MKDFDIGWVSNYKEIQVGIYNAFFGYITKNIITQNYSLNLVLKSFMKLKLLFKTFAQEN